MLESEEKDCNKLSIEAESKTTCPELDDSAQSEEATVLSENMNIELSGDRKSKNQGNVLPPLFPSHYLSLEGKRTFT